VLGITGKLNENPVAVTDASFEVGFGDDEIIVPHQALLRGGFNLAFHSFASKK
jgi:hypothetical protein